VFKECKNGGFKGGGGGYHKSRAGYRDNMGRRKHPQLLGGRGGKTLTGGLKIFQTSFLGDVSGEADGDTCGEEWEWGGSRDKRRFKKGVENRSEKTTLQR